MIKAFIQKGSLVYSNTTEHTYHTTYLLSLNTFM